VTQPGISAIEDDLVSHKRLSEVRAPPDQKAYRCRRGGTVFETIAWATDCSPSALNALTVAKGLAREIGGKLVIIHVQELTVGRAGFFVDPDDAALAGLHRRLRNSTTKA
jgi:hypothetical protein